jgi:hypothetical protein
MCDIAIMSATTIDVAATTTAPTASTGATKKKVKEVAVTAKVAESEREVETKSQNIERD